MDWLNYAYPAVGVVLGGGGIAAFYKARQDARKGLRETELAEDVELANQWRAIIETQTKSLLDPLTDQVAHLQASETTLRVQVRELRDEVAELREERRGFQYRETLLWDWTDRLVDHVNAHRPPPAPDPPSGLKRP